MTDIYGYRNEINDCHRQADLESEVSEWGGGYGRIELKDTSGTMLFRLETNWTIQDLLNNTTLSESDANMDINSAFPSKFLKAADLQGRKLKLTMTDCQLETIGEDDDDGKPVLRFAGKDKGLVLNKTNAQAIAAIYGPSTEGWHGKEIVIYPTKVPYAGNMVDAIRVEKPLDVAESTDEIPF